MSVYKYVFYGVVNSNGVWLINYSNIARGQHLLERANYILRYVFDIATGKRVCVVSTDLKR